MPELITNLGRLLGEPFMFPFMQRALAGTLIVGVVCAIVGAFVVVKGFAFVGDALAHASFAGVALAAVVKMSIYLGAAAAAILTAVAMTVVSRRGRVSSDTAIGVLFVGAFSLGIVMISQLRNYTVDLFGYLFGNVLGIGAEDLWLIGGAGLLVVGLTLLFYKELLFVSFDPIMAEASGVPVAPLQYLLLALLGITIVSAMKVIGIVLVVALLVTPAATATMVTQRFQRVMLLGAAVSVLASVLGLYISYYANVASGASIVLVSTAIFLLVMILPGRTSREAELADLA